jgi:carboxymethylenebutenolidase
MKKTLLLIITFAAIWTSWKSQQLPEPMIAKKEIISCMETETMKAYFQEASQNAFGQMHLSPVKVDAADLMGKMIQFNTADGKQASGYYIAPKKKSKKWLIVIQEWWGLNDNIKMEADKYFKELENFQVLAVDMYDGKVAATPDSAMKISRGADPVRMTTILQGAMQHAGNDASIYSVGWCFGGMWSLQTAILAGNQAKGTIMFYGRPETNMDKLKSIQCDILGFFGNLDRSPSPAMVSEFEKNMETAGKKLTTFKYEAGHGFANPSNPSFNKTATEDSFAKAIAFLKAH